MKILHVITGMRKAAGTSVFAGEVANELIAQGHEVSIAVANPKLDDCYKLDPRVKLICFNEVVVADYDIVHIHALWDLRLSKIAKQIHSPTSTSNSHFPKLVWSPHGMLTPWALKNKWWKKLLGLALYQYWSLRKADLIHVTAQSEVDDVRRLGLKNEVVIAPLGVRIKEDKHHRTPTPSTYTSEQKHTLLFVSRVQRKKGLPNLLEAWARLPENWKKGWAIRIVGPDQDNHTAELMSLCERLEIPYVDQEGNIHRPTANLQPSTLNQPQVAFAGPLYDEQLDAAYSNADLFVLPTHSENFGAVVIEALAHRVPVVCTKEAPWEELETHNCGWWIDIGVEPLVNALKEAMSLSDEERSAMGARGRKLVEEKYTWKAVVKAMVKGYEEILNSIPNPILGKRV